MNMDQNQMMDLGNVMGNGSNVGANPNSPMELKPDVNMLVNRGGGGEHGGQQVMNISFGGGGPGPSSTGNMNNMGQLAGGARPASPPDGGINYPPLSGSKHFCSICGDRASGKHYGVYSCEGCKGFFKRTVRKELTYACRENRDCIIDKKQRNRCQYCRYMKCLHTGMRREAVQEERNRGQGKGRAGEGGAGGGENGGEMENSTSFGDMAIERIIEAENVSENGAAAAATSSGSGTGVLQKQMMGQGSFKSNKKKMLHQLVEWAKRIPRFTDLRTEDQIKLIRAGWNELLIAGCSFRSMQLDNGILWADSQLISRENAHLSGVGEIFDRVLVELVGKMREMKMDKAELGCLRAIILFNPDAKGLEQEPSLQVEGYREKVYATLEEYCRTNHENEPSRFAKLLLRLPALRSIGLKCVEHLFFFKLIKDDAGSAGDNSSAENNGNNAVEASDAASQSLDIFIKDILED